MADATTTFYGLVEPTPGGDSNTWGGLLNAGLVTLDTIIGLPRIARYTPTISGSTVTINLSLGTVALYTVVGSTTFAFANVPTGSFASQVLLVLTNGGVGTLTWPGSVSWVAGAAPTLQSSGVDLLLFRTVDNGTTWYGSKVDPTRLQVGSSTTMARPVLTLLSSNPGNFTNSSEASIASVVLKANTFATVGDTVRVVVRGLVSGADSALRVELGSTYFANTVPVNNLTTNVGFTLDCTLVRTGTNLVGGDSTTISGTAVTLNDHVSPASVTLTSDQTLDIRGIANGGATVVVNSVTVTLVRA